MTGRSRSRGGRDFQSRPPRGFDIEIAAETGPLAGLADRRVVCVADFQNLEFSAYDLGFRLDWNVFAGKFSAGRIAAELHVVLSEAEADKNSLESLADGGWHVHVKRIDRREQGGGNRSNADNLFAFVSGQLAVRSDEFELFVIGTGDGELGLDVAQALVSVSPALEIATLSVAGSTSQRLNSCVARDIDFNLEVGRDCLI